jgi:hypothetical protein
MGLIQGILTLRQTSRPALALNSGGKMPRAKVWESRTRWVPVQLCPWRSQSTGTERVLRSGKLSRDKMSQQLARGVRLSGLCGSCD